MSESDDARPGLGQDGTRMVNRWHRLPRWIRRGAAPVAFCVGLPRMLARRLRRLRPEVWVVSGTEPNSQLAHSVLCAANPDEVRHVLDLMFAPGFEQRRVGSAWLWKLGRLATATAEECSLMVVGVQAAHRHLLKLPTSLYIPNWLMGEVDLPLDPGVLKRESVRSDLRKIKRNELKYEVTQDPARFDEFYHQMYVPYITRTHGHSAFVTPYPTAKREFEGCELLLVSRGALVAGGMLIVRREPVPRIWSLGIRDGDRQHVKDGVLAALFHFTFDHLAAGGFRRVKLGWSRAFLRDGVLQFKRKLSQTLTSASPAGTALQILAWTPATQAFVTNNPFIIEADGQLSGAVFTEEDITAEPSTIAEIEKSHWHPGMARVSVYRFRSAGSSTVTPNDVALGTGRVVACCAGDLVV